jgi:hypothetical protein
MTYNIQLGKLATQAVTELMLAEPSRDLTGYRSFLRKSSEFCQAIKQSAPALTVDQARPDEMTHFLSAVVKGSERRSSGLDRDRLARVEAVEPLIRQLLEENRAPSQEEQLRIVELLHLGSAADFS